MTKSRGSEGEDMTGPDDKPCRMDGCPGGWMDGYFPLGSLDARVLSAVVLVCLSVLVFLINNWSVL